jgi:hypothetical protein
VLARVICVLHHITKLQVLAWSREDEEIVHRE